MNILIRDNTKLIEGTAEILPYRYFLTVCYRNWGVTQFKSMQQLARTDLFILSRRNKSHIQPIVGINTDKTRAPHHHSILLSEKPLSVECFKSFDTHQSIDIKPYSHSVNGIVYCAMKHEHYPMTLIHPRDKRAGCNCNACSIANHIRRL